MTKRRLERLRAVRLALEEFDLRYPNEARCLDVLFDWLFSSEQLHCVDCGAELCRRIPGSRSMDCSSCTKTTWFTAGSFFHKARKIRERFAVKWLMEKGVVFNSSILKDVLDLAGSTAWEIFHEITSLLADKMSQDQFPVLSSTHFREVITRRSKLSLAAEHPQAEFNELSGSVNSNDSYPSKDENTFSNSDVGESENCLGESKEEEVVEVEEEEEDDDDEEEEEEEESDRSALPKMELPDNFSGTSNIMSGQKHGLNVNQECLSKHQGESEAKQAAILALLKSGTHRFDKILVETGMEYQDLCMALCLLEISGRVERGFGDVYSLLKPATPETGSLSEEELNTVCRFTKWVKEHFGGISLKYLQNYLAYSWYVWDRKRCGKGELLRNLILSVTETTCRNKSQSPILVAVFKGEASLD